ncbi:MAG: helix-turn-helix transcriptional regulator, partial [Cellulosilyticaceae bacterium]
SRDYVLGKIDFLVQDKQIPQPTFIVDSGRGCYLIWKINPVPAQAVKLWRRLEDQFFEALKELGADASCLDPSRVLRVDGSINSKNGKVVQVIDYRPIVYSINDLQTEYLVPFPHKERKLRPKYTFPKKENILYLNESPSLYHKRLQDIQMLVKIRQGNMIGCRELACFLTRYWTYCVTKDKAAALAATLALNQQFIDPLTEIEVTKWTNAPDKALRLQAYRYSHKRLINLLKITPEEEEQLESIISRKVWEKKRKRRQREQAVIARQQENKLTSREQKKQDTQNNIIIYYKKGYSQKDIAETLGLSVRTVQRHYREIKNIKEDQ